MRPKSAAGPRSVTTVPRMTSPSPRFTAGLLRPVLADFIDLVDGIGDEQVARPTPCTAWDVSALVDHVTAMLDLYTQGLAHPDGELPPGVYLDRSQSPQERADVLRGTAQLLDEAVLSGGADRQLSSGGDGADGDMVMWLLLWEAQIHGWDLAAALGEPWERDEGALVESIQCRNNFLPAQYRRDGPLYAPPVPVSALADPLETLLGYSGRDPWWTRP